MVYRCYHHFIKNGRLSDNIIIDKNLEKENRKSEIDEVVDKLLPVSAKKKNMKSIDIIQLFLSKMTIREKEEIVDRMFGSNKSRVKDLDIALANAEIPEIF